MRPMSAVQIGGSARRRLSRINEMADGLANAALESKYNYKPVEKKKRPSTAGATQRRSSEELLKGSLSLSYTPNVSSRDPSVGEIKRAQLQRKMGPRTMARRHEKLVEHHAGGAISLLRGRDNVVLKHLNRGRQGEEGTAHGDTARNLMAKAMSLKSLGGNE